MGRKTDLTPDLQAKLEKVFVGGASIKDACDYVGITDRAYYYWMARGEKARKGDDLYIQFFHIMKKARATGKIDAIARIRQAAVENWQAAAWFLERSDPANWGRRDKLTIEGDVPLDLINRIIRAMERAGVESASSAFEDLLNEYANAADRAAGSE